MRRGLGQDVGASSRLGVTRNGKQRKNDERTTAAAVVDCGWSSTDTTVVSIRRDAWPAPRWVEAHAVGSAKVIVAFHRQRDAIDVIVARTP